jgi:uncharacterized protein (DUF2252 family)
MHATAGALADRLAAGKALRARVPRSAHGSWSPSAERPDPLSLLQAADGTRVPELVPIRYGRMLTSPFTFLRGAAALMASDLVTTPSTGITVQVCGDAHLSNFGAFATPERNLIFDLNDFDETLPGPWEWDVKRLAASVVVAGRANAFAASACAEAACTAVRAYREHIGEFARTRTLEAWYTQVDAAAVLSVLTGASQKAAARSFEQATRRDHMRAFRKLTAVVDGRLRIVEDPPLVTHIPDEWLGDRLHTLTRAYLASLPDEMRRLFERYRMVDVARKVVGVGSVGTHCYIVLLMGRDTDDPLFIQLKEATTSVLEPFLSPSAYSSSGQRVVCGQRLMQAASDIFLGWGDVDTMHFYMRQLHDMKGSAVVEAMSRADLVAYAALCGWALARAHARSGAAAEISGYLGCRDTFDTAVTAFADAYADQTERDHAALVAAVRAGRIDAETGI